MIREFAKEISIEQIAKAAKAQIFVLWFFWTVILGIFIVLTLYQTVVIGVALNKNEIQTTLKVISLSLFLQFVLLSLFSKR